MSKGSERADRTGLRRHYPHQVGRKRL